MTEPGPRDEPRVVVRRGRQQGSPPGCTWLLVALIVVAFALGVVLVATGLLVPDEGTGVPPGPTAFTLTPQIVETGTPAP